VFSLRFHKAALLETVDKGDAYDFSFKSDGGFNMQKFEGVDYADPKVTRNPFLAS
jgi:hypothetical protein